MTTRNKKKRKYWKEPKQYEMNICPNCGKVGRHYVPPSLGEEGFFLCDDKDFNVFD